MRVKREPDWDEVARRLANSEAAGECLLYAGMRNRDGYGTVTIDYEVYLTHRLAWSLANGPIPRGMMVLHSCDNPPCIRLEHLRVGTHTDNMRDKRERDRCVKGEAHGRSVLTEEQVHAIRDRLRRGDFHRVIAHDYGVSKRSVWNIAHGVTWSWLKSEETIDATR